MNPLEKQLQAAHGKDCMRRVIDELEDGDTAVLLVARGREPSQTVVQIGCETVAMYVYTLHCFLFGEMSGEFRNPDSAS